MQKSPILAAGFLASLLSSGLAPADEAADKNFGRLSTDGVSAFNDLHLARIAIFDGKTDEAAKFVADAQASLAKARQDDTILTKDEASFKVPGAKPGKRPEPGPAIAWIPIDSEFVLGETFQSTPEKAAAMVTARKGLDKGDGAAALQAIRLAKVDVDYTVALAPLDRSVTDVDAAAKHIAEHDWYAASQSLKLAEDGIRFDEIDDVGSVVGKPVAMNGKGH